MRVARWEWPWQWERNGYAFSRAGAEIEVRVDTMDNIVELNIDQGVEECVSVRMTGGEVNQLVGALRKAQGELKESTP
ncbi:hypothetical protein LCGC14_2314670 [marine sediment metagenome]|uniref:Uncharacterized protein n=1 Tax=marine sediment metagenome TaxID=412755 RepID=A0A0F9EX30_9ZZZZ